MSREQRVEALGMAGGVAVAVVCLIGLSVWLLSPEAVTAKVLVAVWLWALPLTGVCTLAGWLLARLANRIGGA